MKRSVAMSSALIFQTLSVGLTVSSLNCGGASRIADLDGS
jgi:hypothetical protein